MRSTSYLILLISLWSSVCLAQQNNGARLAISLKQVTDFYNSHNGLFFMQARSANPIALPDFAYPEGNVSVHNASIHLMPPRNLDIAAVGQNSFSISLSDLSATIWTSNLWFTDLRSSPHAQSDERHCPFRPRMGCSHEDIYS